MIRILATIAIIFLLMIIILLKMLIKSYYNNGGKEKPEAEASFLPFPLGVDDNNHKATQIRNYYHLIAKIGMGILVAICVTIVVLSITDYFSS